MANQPNPNFGTGEPGTGGSQNFTPPVHGYMPGYGEVTASFGQGPAEGQTLLAPGHVPTRSQFDGHPGHRGHEHFDPHGQNGGPNRGIFGGR